MSRQQHATQNREPLHGRREVHPAEVGGQLEVAGSTHRSLTLASEDARTGWERVESRMLRLRTEVRPRGPLGRGSPGSLSLPDTCCHHIEPAERRNNALRASMGRRSPRSIRGRPLRDARTSVTRPAKGEILVKIEVPSVRSTEPPTRGWRVKTRARFPSSTSVTWWSSVPRRLVDRDESR